MKVEQTVCNECKTVKGESNHWFKIGVLMIGDRTVASGGTDVQLTLGVVPDKPMPGYEVHDLCGAQCFHRHIDRLLGNATAMPTEPPPLPTEDAITTEVWR